MHICMANQEHIYIVADDMTESTDTMKNCRQSSSNNGSIINLVLALTTHQQKYVNDENGLLDSDRHYLTLFDLQPVPISDQNLSVFDELSHQFDAVLHSSNLQRKSPSTIGINNFHSSHLMPTTMINDYERRFQRSLQKLTIPSWYTDLTSSSKASSKQSIISTTTLLSIKAHYNESQRTPEIIHVHRPHSYRSCRSSLATSPSSSARSWHPNHMIDGMNFSLLIPSSSSRRYNKYEKGMERVSKSSHWYQPTQFVDNKTNDQTGIIKISTSNKYKQKPSINNHYDTPKFEIFKSKSPTEQPICLLVTNGDVKNTSDSKQNNNMITNDKQQDNHIDSNESQIMPLANTKEPFSRIELEEVIDEEDDNQSLSMVNNKDIPSLPLSLNQTDDNESDKSLERIANELVDSILGDILLLKNLNDNEDDTNSGVRELSEDENGLRELDENDMCDTDEFIVFAAKEETSDDDQTTNTRRHSLNRLYTFSKINENSKETVSNQNSPKSIFEKDVVLANIQSETNTKQLFDSSLIDHSHIQKQHNNFDQYIDDTMCPSNSQLPTHPSSEGVNEETARIGRLLLDGIPISSIENVHNLSQTPTSARSISKSKSTRGEEYQRQFIDEYDEGLSEEICRDSGYSSNQERLNIQQSLYEPLSECYSGYSFIIPSDFLTPNVSSLQSTTDEAYESELTTMSSSTATTSHVHPNLEHEFDYPTPPPPVPDRRLKPAHLKSLPTTKPRLSKQETVDSVGYSIIQKTKPLPLTAIQHLIASTSNDSTSPSTRTMSSRNYCGSIPVSNDATSSSMKTTEHSKDKNKEKRITKTLSCLHSSAIDDNDNKRKSSSSSLNKTKAKKQLKTEFDEATNGLAILLPAPMSTGHDLSNKQNINRTSTPSSTKRVNGMTKNRQIPHNLKSDRSPFYETSV